MPISPGTRLGPFQVLAPLGAGGMGEVWRARDTRLGREVALKVLPEAFADEADRIARFQREAQLLAAFNHPNIAAIYSFEAADGIRLLVMEMVPGDTVKQLLAAGPLSLSRALGIARQVADALDAAHGKGILHRDLKPANVKVTPEGKVKLLDFGLAKAFGPASEVADLSGSPTLDTGGTRQGTVLGTAPYMSPEQARGKTLDWRTDVWSFGCLLYEMLSGRKAFQGESTSDVLAAILDRDPDWSALPLGTPPAVLDLLRECLAKSRDARTPDLAHARQTIDAVLEGRAVSVTRSALSGRIRRSPRAFAAGGAVLAVALAALLWIALRGKDTKALPATKLLAILPAADFTGRADGRLFCDGVSAGLRVKLQQLPGLQVMLPSGPETSRETDAAKAARDTGANVIVQPVVRQAGDQMKFSFSVSLAASPVQVASGEVTGPVSEPFRLEDELAAQLVAALELQVAGGAAVSAPAARPLPPGAPQNDYVVALGFLERYDDAASVGKAIDLLTRIPDGSESAPVQAALGRAYLASYGLSKDASEADRARTSAERAIALDKELPEAQVTLGRILTVTGKPAEAVKEIEKALERRPDDVPAISALAFALQRTGRLAEAEKAFLRATELRPTWWASFNQLGWFYFWENRYPEAEKAFRKAISLNPDVARVHSNLGAVLIRLERLDEAEEEFRQSIALKPEGRALSNLATTQYLLGKYDEAAASFEKALQLLPQDFGLWINLGDACRHSRRGPAEARAAYEKGTQLGEKILALDPADAVDRAFIAFAYAQLGQKEVAWTYVTTALGAAPKDGQVLYRCALVANALGKEEEAIGLLERAVSSGYGRSELKREPDLSNLRNVPRFRKLVSS